MADVRPKFRAFTPAEVRNVRKMLDGGVSATTIAPIYRCAAETVRKIGRRETYNWVEEEEGATMEAAKPAEPRDPFAPSEGLWALQAEVDKRSGKA